MKKTEKILFNTNLQRILYFLLDYLGKEFLEKEIQNSTKISKSGINYALRELSRTKMIYRKKRGKSYFCSLNYESSIIRQLKILKTILFIEPAINRLKSVSSSVILFGSSSRGENIRSSDVDLFVISNLSKQKIKEKISDLRITKDIQLIVKSELKFVELKKKDYTFYKQIRRGIVLWEKE